MIFESAFFLFLAALISGAAWFAYQSQPARRLYASAILIGMIYWYILPGSMFTAGLAAGTRDLYLLRDQNSVLAAMLIVLSSLALMLLTPSLLRPNFGRFQEAGLRVNRHIRSLAGVALVSAILILVLSFAEFGLSIMFSVLSGEETARSLMSFDNRSSGLAQSLIALLQIITAFTSVFCIAFVTINRQFNSSIAFMAFTALVLLLISTGTRSFLLMGLFVIIVGLVCRSSRETPNQASVRPRRPRVVFFAINISIAIMAIISIYARFRDNVIERDELLLNSVSSHNDMFRELIFILSTGREYSRDMLSYLLTPVSFALPSFLGFEKSIPSHLVDFNLIRANIDLIHGQGNVFPGLIGDAYILTGAFAPIFIMAVTLIMFSIFQLSVERRKNSVIELPLLCALLSYFFISLRNLQGSLLIVVTISILLRIMLNHANAKVQYE